jgi:hypothetical protein
MRGIRTLLAIRIRSTTEVRPVQTVALKLTDTDLHKSYPRTVISAACDANSAYTVTTGDWEDGIAESPAHWA